MGYSLLTWALVLAQGSQPGHRSDFFEKKIRPLLASRCANCHGDQVQMANIQLTSREGLTRSQTVVPGNPGASRLVQALRYSGKVKMPPTGMLSAEEIQAVEQWIGDGAEWPETSSPTSASTKKHWAFIPVGTAPVPEVRDAAWARTEIDRFVLAPIEAKNLTVAPDADKYALLRRVTLDLTGLLPSVAEIHEFAQDSSPQAFERVVDRLLASPAYGDRWGRHWLDVTYWADTTGAGRRIPLREAWRYRDYVIESFNADKPYNRFVQEQIAGPDEKEAKGAEAATGFLVIGPWQWIAYDRVQLRADVADLQVDLIGRTFLGLTLGCARCHDHKFDPIPNKDYFALTGIFLSTKTLATDNVDGGINTVRLPETLGSVKQYASDVEAWDQRVAAAEVTEKKNQEEQAGLKKRIEELKALPESDGQKAQLRAVETDLEAAKKKSGVAGDRQILPFERYMRPRMPEVYAARDMDFPENARIAMRGDAHRLGDAVPRGFLTAVAFQTPPNISPHESGRKELAEWIASDKNPLTARVYVNRVWQHLFGKGIVSSSDNFGARGERPTHPELLDYLAESFIRSGWSTKKLIRQIVLSHVYQLSSSSNPKTDELDPDNRLLSRANRRRLEAEAIRDTVLQVSDQLDSGRGGPSLPLTAQNVHTIAPFFLEEDSIIENRVRNRRTVYQPVMRSGQMTDVDILNLFDFADPDQVVGTRAQTMVPTQSLYLLNAKFLQDAARKLAESLVNDDTLDDSGRVQKVTLITLNRPAVPAEIAEAKEFLGAFQKNMADGTIPRASRVEAWSKYCHAILASSEFLYRR